MFVYNYNVKLSDNGKGKVPQSFICGQADVVSQPIYSSALYTLVEVKEIICRDKVGSVQ